MKIPTKQQVWLEGAVKEILEADSSETFSAAYVQAVIKGLVEHYAAKAEQKKKRGGKTPFNSPRRGDGEIS